MYLYLNINTYKHLIIITIKLLKFKSNVVMGSSLVKIYIKTTFVEMYNFIIIMLFLLLTLNYIK